MNIRTTGRAGLARNSGKYAWSAKVACISPNGTKTVQNITVFSDDRADAIREACNAVTSYGYRNCTVNHITRV